MSYNLLAVHTHTHTHTHRCTHTCACIRSCTTLCDHRDRSSQGSSVHGISQTVILQWVAISSSRGFPDPGMEPASPAWQVGSLLLSYQESSYTHTHTHMKTERKISLLFHLWMEHKFLLSTARLPHLGIWHWHPHALFQTDFWAVCAFNPATAQNPALKGTTSSEEGQGKLISRLWAPWSWQLL